MQAIVDAAETWVVLASFRSASNSAIPEPGETRNIRRMTLRLSARNDVQGALQRLPIAPADNLQMSFLAGGFSFTILHGVPGSRSPF